MPEFALKELKAGPMSAWIWCHNKFNETRSFADTIAAIGVISATPRRNFAASARQALEQAAQVDKQSFAKVLNLHRQTETILDKALADRYRFFLRRRILIAWERRRSVAKRISMPLPCFTEGELETDSHGGLSFERYSCPRNADCAVFMELVSRPVEIKLLMDVISNEPLKAENQRRYQALRHIVRTPKKPFSDGQCRSLGDAVFAIMAPPNSVILTTNLKDHAPLAGALGKVAVEPNRINSG